MKTEATPRPWKVINNGHGMYSILDANRNTVNSSMDLDKLELIVRAVNHFDKLVAERNSHISKIELSAIQQMNKTLNEDNDLFNLENQRLEAENQRLREEKAELVEHINKLQERAIELYGIQIEFD